MKHDLEGYREIILVINSVLKWDKPFYAGIVFAVVTFAYLLLWYLNLSILTLFSLICLTSILSEFAIPLVSKFIPKSDNWTGAQEKTFEEVCIDILNVRICVGGLIKYLFLSKDEKTLKASIPCAISATHKCFYWKFMVNMYAAIKPNDMLFFVPIHSHLVLFDNVRYIRSTCIRWQYYGQSLDMLYLHGIGCFLSRSTPSRNNQQGIPPIIVVLYATAEANWR